MCTYVGVWVRKPTCMCSNKYANIYHPKCIGPGLLYITFIMLKTYLMCKDKFYMYDVFIPTCISHPWMTNIYVNDSHPHCTEDPPLKDSQNTILSPAMWYISRWSSHTHRHSSVIPIGYVRISTTKGEWGWCKSAYFIRSGARRGDASQHTSLDREHTWMMQVNIIQDFNK